MAFCEYSSPLYLRETMSDSNKVFSTNKTLVALTAALTSARTLTLPAANSFPAGTSIKFIDEAQTITATNTVTVTRAGADTIDGNTTYVITESGAVAEFTTDGSSKWSGGVISAPAVNFIDWTDWSASDSLVGFSDTTIHVCRYSKIGKTVFMYVLFDGTSNATNLTFTLPFTSANIGQVQTSLNASITDNGTASTTPGRVSIAANSTTCTCQKTRTGTAWTASGNKVFQCLFFYEAIS